MATHFELYTNEISVDTNGVLIEKAQSAANGKIPSDLAILAVSIEPQESADAYYIKGCHSEADWILQKAGQIYTIEGLDASVWRLFYVKSTTGTITMNLSIKGTHG